MSEIADNLKRVQDRIATAAARSGRDSSAIRLVAVTKTQPPERIARAAELGVIAMGENRVQEAADKIPRVHQIIGRRLEWHLVGTLQRNKVRTAIELFAILEAVDSTRLAETISRRAAGRRIPILLEVYVGDDSDRPGFRPAELVDYVPRLLELPGIEIRGLMTVAPFGWDESRTRSCFERVRELRGVLRERYPAACWDELSMGMSDDFPLAIEEGATIVRVGRAIFGER